MIAPTADQPPARAASAVAVQVEQPGCWLAAPCLLRITATAPWQLDAEPPGLLARVPSIDVLQITPEGSSTAAAPAAWLVELIAFEPGDVAVPRFTVRLVTADGVTSPLVAPPLTLHVQQRQHAVGTALADIELSPPPLPLVEIAAAAGAGLIGLLMAWWLRRLVRRGRLIPRLVLPRVLQRLSIRWRGRWVLHRIRRGRATRPAPDTYTQIVDLIRRMVQPRLGRRALSSTSSELTAAIDRLPRPVGAPGVELAPLLRRSDLVKFAGYQPTGQEVAADCDRARAVVRALDRGGLTTSPRPLP